MVENRVRKEQVYWKYDDNFPDKGWVRWTNGEVLPVDLVEEFYH